MFHGPRSVEDTREYLERMLASQKEDPRIVWEVAVVATATDRLVGACDLTCENEREADLGFIFAKDVWGMGYATEAARAMVDAGFGQLRPTRIFSTCDIANAASARVLKKAGLTRVATLERHKYALGKWWTSYLYEIRSGE